MSTSVEPRACSTLCVPRAYVKYSSAAPLPLTGFMPKCPCGKTRLKHLKLRTEPANLPPSGSSKIMPVLMGWATHCLRYFNASGADADGNFGEDRRHESHLIPLILQVAVGRRPKVLIYGDDYATRDGSCVRDYVHTADLAQAHQLAVESLEPGMGRAYNLGSGTGVTVLEVLRACEKVTGTRNSARNRRPSPRRSGSVNCQPSENQQGIRLVATLYKYSRYCADRLELASSPPSRIRSDCLKESECSHCSVSRFLRILNRSTRCPSPICLTGIRCLAKRHCGARLSPSKNSDMSIHRFSLRRYEGELVDEQRSAERERTRAVLDVGAIGTNDSSFAN